MATDDAAEAGKAEDLRPQETEKVAPRPHPITVRLALLGPVATIVAVTVGGVALAANFRSLDIARQAVAVNHQAMKVGQRAYVVARNGSAILVVAPAEHLSPGDPPGSVVLMPYQFEVHNLGRTPAMVDSFSMTFSAPPGWTLRSTGWTHGDTSALMGRFDYRQQVGQDSFIEMDQTAIFRLDAQAAQQRGFVQLRMDAEIAYQDVFGDTHTIRWCWYIHDIGSADATGGGSCGR